jgi:trimeric autotransporter adhesin
MDILNFISWIKAGKYSPTMPADAITVVGVPNPTRGDAYLPVTVPVTALQTNIGKLLGGGIVVAEWDENGVKKALIASLTNLSFTAPWTIFAYATTLIGPTAQSFANGSTNTDAIIAQTGVPATTAYAAGLARLYLGGGFTDWYLPALWELALCYNSAAIVNKVLGDVNGFSYINFNYWSSTESDNSNAWGKFFNFGGQGIYSKTNNFQVRAVRIHTL